VDANISACADCRQEIDTLRPVIGCFVSWPIVLLRPPASLWDRLATQIGIETGKGPASLASEPDFPSEWEEAAPGILLQIASDGYREKAVSMLVRLAPGTDYPPHRHAVLKSCICFTAN